MTNHYAQYLASQNKTTTTNTKVGSGVANAGATGAGKISGASSSSSKGSSSSSSAGSSSGGSSYTGSSSGSGSSYTGGGSSSGGGSSGGSSGSSSTGSSVSPVVSTVISAFKAATSRYNSGNAPTSQIKNSYSTKETARDILKDPEHSAYARYFGYTDNRNKVEGPVVEKVGAFTYGLVSAVIQDASCNLLGEKRPAIFDNQKTAYAWGEVFGHVLSLIGGAVGGTASISMIAPTTIGGLGFAGASGGISVPATWQADTALAAAGSYCYAVVGTAIGNLAGTDPDDLIPKGDSETVTNNQGKKIDITPNKSHTTSNKNPGYKGESNSSLDILDKDGNVVTRRWFDENGNAIRDVDMTNHGNPKQHPEWPHEHFWEYGPDGKPINR